MGNEFDIPRALGQLEGRLGAMEQRQAEAEARHAREIGEVNAKLDAVLEELNQGMGGLKAGLMFASLAGAIGSAVWALLARFWK